MGKARLNKVRCRLGCPFHKGFGCVRVFSGERMCIIEDFLGECKSCDDRFDCGDAVVNHDVCPFMPESARRDFLFPKVHWFGSKEFYDLITEQGKNPLGEGEVWDGEPVG